MSEYKMIVLDLDGTLTNRNKEITPKTKETLMKAQEQGKIVVMTTQVPNEGSDLSVYHVGGHLKNTLHLLEAFDMTTEAAVCKLMWILGQTKEFEQVRELFNRPVAWDILTVG